MSKRGLAGSGEAMESGDVRRSVGEERSFERSFDFEEGPLIWVEINQQKLPIFLFKSRNRQEQEYEAFNVIRAADGRRLEQYWKITAHKDFGLPTPQDRDVYVALMKLIHLRGGMPSDGLVRFSLYEILHILGKTEGGPNFENVRLSLDRIGSTSIYAENAFYAADKEEFQSHRFTPWSVHLSRKKRAGSSSERHAVKFHEILVQSYNAGYLRVLDADFYFSLSRSMSKSLYGLVDVSRENNLSWSDSR